MVDDMTKKIIKVNSNEFKNSSRDERELNVYKELGASVLVVAKGIQDNHKQIDNVNGFDVMRLGTRPLKIAPSFINRALSIIIWARIIRALKADVLSGRDLEGLLISYLSTIWLYKKNKPKIVYDSHEFEMGRQRVLNSKFKTFVVKKLEKYLISKCCVSIFVSESIEKAVVRTYHLKSPTIVVRNIPPIWELCSDKIIEKRIEFKNFFKRDYFIIMYHGAILPYRGIERMLEAASRFNDVACVLLGMVNEKYLGEIKSRISSLNIQDRVYYHDTVPLDELRYYIAATNVGMVTIEPNTMSYYYSLPNKLFENIQSLTPVIVSDFPDMADLINRHQIGISVNPLSVDDIEDAIKKMKENVSFYYGLKENLADARKVLCWEVEKEKLVNAYHSFY